MKHHDTKQCISYEDGWLLIGPLNYPIEGGWCRTREEARQAIKERGLLQTRIVPARSIVVWKKA
jgi:hypothetical protein